MSSSQRHARQEAAGVIAQGQEGQSKILNRPTSNQRHPQLIRRSLVVEEGDRRLILPEAAT